MRAPATDRAKRAHGAARATAVLLAVLSLATALSAIGLDVAIAARGLPPPLAAGWSGAVPGLALAIPGALLLFRISWHPVAVALLGYGVWWCIDGLASAWVNATTTILPGAPGAAVAFWLFERLGAGLLTVVPVVLVLFPDGRLPAGRWRPPAIAAVVCTAIMPLTSLVAPAAELSDQSIESLDPRLVALAEWGWTLPLAPGAWPVVLLAARIALVLGLIGSVAVVVHRRRGADEVRRAQLRWLVWAAFVAVLSLLSWFVLPVAASTVLQTVGLATLPVAVVVAVARYRLYEIDALLGWTVISAMLLSSFVLADLVLAGLLGASLGEGPVTVLAAVIVAGVYVPFRRRLRRLVARVVSGEREEPYAVIAGLAEELEHVHTSQEQLDIVTRAIVRAFRTPYVRLELERADGSTLTSEDGTADVVGEPRPIAYRGRVIGSLTMAPARLPRLSRRDRRLLDDLVRQAAAAVSASDANDQLRSIRTALVNAREDERRRMRDELHDGVGPVLAGVVLRLDAVAGRLGSEHALRESISALADDASKAVDEVRRISQGLGPAALAELGLERAVLEQCERLSAGDGCRISARVELGAPLPVATDVAVYRIVSEALTNVVRHSGARTASVRITATADAVEVEIADDGRGLPQTVAPGTGLASQRQRALELGGTWSAGPAPGGGTRVHATIPLTTATTEGQPA